MGRKQEQQLKQAAAGMRQNSFRQESGGVATSLTAVHWHGPTKSADLCCRSRDEGLVHFFPNNASDGFFMGVSPFSFFCFKGPYDVIMFLVVLINF